MLRRTNHNMVASFGTMLLAVATLTVPQPANAVLQLTVDNFETLTTGKSVFIKFFAPWCGHCRAMAADWEKLEAAWKDHEVGLIAEVDCTTDGGQPLCEEFDVQGFPTLVFGDPHSAEIYDGPRDYESLSEHAKDHISKPICGVFQVDACTEEDTAAIASLLTKTTDDLEAIIQQVADKIQLEEVTFDEKVQEIQKQYDEVVKEFNKNLDSIKNEHHYKYVEQIISHRLVEAEKAAAMGDNEL